MELNLNNEEAKVNEDYYLKGNLESGIEGIVAKNNQLYNDIKSGTCRKHSRLTVLITKLVLRMVEDTSNTHNTMLMQLGKTVKKDESFMQFMELTILSLRVHFMR